MKYEIPNGLLNWNELSDEEFISIYEDRRNEGQRRLMISYLFHHDVPLEWAGDPRGRTTVHDVSQVFERNSAFDLKIPDSDFRRLYSMEGIQLQYNEVVRMQYYHRDREIGCIAYYIEATEIEGEIRKEIKTLILCVDRSYVERSQFFDRMMNKHGGSTAGVQAVLMAFGSFPQSNSKGFIDERLAYHVNRKYEELIASKKILLNQENAK